MKVAILPKLTYSFGTILIIILTGLHFLKMEIDSWVLKFIWKSKDLEIAKNNLEKEEKVGGLILPDIKVYCEALFIKAVWY